MKKRKSVKKAVVNRNGKDESSLERNLSTLIRYLLLLILMFTLPVIYLIFTPLTIYPVFFILKLLFKDVILNQNFIIINLKTVIQLIPSCIGGSAYLLLLILNLTIPMKINKRALTLVTSFAMLLGLNIFRIITLTLMSVNKSLFFDISHKLFWYGLSTVFVVAIWFAIIKMFKIEEVPIYTDIKYLLKNIKSSS